MNCGEGFIVLKIGEVYSRNELHLWFGGQSRSRISTPANHDIIMLFTANGSARRNGDYPSGWTSYGVFRFVGEGRRGHMAFTRGNRALREHTQRGKQVHLFVRVYPDNGDAVRYEGEFTYRGHFYKEGKDQHGDTRRMIVFVLKPVDEMIFAR